MKGGGIMSWALFPHTAALAWVPWLTMGVILHFRRGWRHWRIVTLAIVTAALALSGHPEVAAIGGVFAALCGLSLRKVRRPLIMDLLGAGAAALLGLALAAPQLVPFATVLHDSQRAAEKLATPIPVIGAELAVPSSWFLPGWGPLLATQVNPRVFGTPFTKEFHGPLNSAEAMAGYAGLALFGGALAAFAVTGRRRALPFLLWALLSTLAAAHFFPLLWLMSSVSVLKALAYQRFLLVGALALAIGGALGLDALMRSSRRSAGLTATAIAAIVSIWVHPSAFTILLWTLILAAAFLLRKRRLAGWLILFVALSVDLVPWARNVLPRGNPGLFFPRTNFMARLGDETSLHGPWRATGEDYAVYPSILPVYGVAEFRPHNPLAPIWQLRSLNAAFGFAPAMGNYFSSSRNLGHPLLDFLNVRYVVWSSPDPVPADFELVATDGGAYRLYRNPNALPRWFFPSRVDVVSEDRLDDWIRALDDPKRIAVAEGAPTSWLEAPDSSARVEATLFEPGRIQLRVDAPHQAVLATSIPRYAGWSATAAGTKLPTLAINGGFIGVVVPAGPSDVTLSYRPPGLGFGFGAALVSLIVCTALMVRRNAAGAARGTGTP